MHREVVGSGVLGYAQADGFLREWGRTDLWFNFVFLLFLWGQLFNPVNLAWDIGFYVLTGPTILYLAWRRRRELLNSPGIPLLLALCGYFLLSSFWSGNVSQETLALRALGAFTNAVFVFGAILFFAQPRPRVLALLDATVLLAGAAALVSLALFLFRGDIGDERLSGVGQNANPILAAMVYGIYALIALFRAWQVPSVALKGLFLAVVAVIGTVVLLTQSRGPILAMIVITPIALLVLGHRANRTAVMGSVLVMAGGAVAGLFAVQVLGEVDILSYLLTRGDSHRLEIWAHTLHAVGEAPVVGHGLASDFGLKPQFSHPHNIFLAALYDGGLVGLALFVAFIGVLAVAAWRNRDDFLVVVGTVLLVFSLLGGLTAFGHILRSPSTHWIVQWLPVAIILGAVTRRANVSRSTPLGRCYGSCGGE